VSSRLRNPQGTDSVQEMQEILQENVRKFKSFSTTALNPLTIADLVEELEAVNVGNVDRAALAEAPPVIE